MDFSYSVVRYKNWLHTWEGQGPDLPALMAGIWRFLKSGDGADCRDLEHGFYCLSYYVAIAQNRQNSLVFDLCRRYGADYHQSLYERATSLYLDAQKGMDRFLQMERDLDQRSLHKYLYNSLKYILKKCNSEWIETLHDPNRVSLPAESIDESGELGSGAKAIIRSGYGSPSIEYYQYRMEIKAKAKELATSLVAEWKPSKLNVLCQLYEKMYNLDTIRLADESNAYIHKLHQRLRDDLTGLVTDGVCSRDELDEMLRSYMPEICQATPASSTYIMRKTDNLEMT